jgi:hypothetical protein
MVIIAWLRAMAGPCIQRRPTLCASITHGRQSASVTTSPCTSTKLQQMVPDKALFVHQMMVSFENPSPTRLASEPLSNPCDQSPWIAYSNSADQTVEYISEGSLERPIGQALMTHFLCSRVKLQHSYRSYNDTVCQSTLQAASEPAGLLHFCSKI